jgi:aminoglycoside phosphotransferase (APT) family kinase protein
MDIPEVIPPKPIGRPTIGRPPAECDIDSNLVHRLLLDQHPDLASLPLTLVDAGWDNVMYRLGEGLAVRLPRRQLAAKLIEHEQTWLPQLAAQLPLTVPTPRRVGQPALGYPWRWSVVPWLSGVAADLEAPTVNEPNFAAFLRALHQPAPADAPVNLYRGVPLTQRATMVAERMDRLASQTDLINTKLEKIWLEALAAPIDLMSTWLHGDLHPGNILVTEGQVSGVIDWGDLTAGDAATDLASIWMLFAEARQRQEVLASYGNLSAASLRRAKGWAIFFGVVLLEAGLVDNPKHARVGENTLRRVLVDG